ncbi:MAG: tol-pal system protein YbgF [Rickettsiales bacterium]|nr:tol-pal system protein YbgF [Rickettsiales bacterium]
MFLKVRNFVIIATTLIAFNVQANETITIEYGNDDKNRLNRLEQDLRTLKKVVYKNTPSYPVTSIASTSSFERQPTPSTPAQSTAILGVKIQELEQQLHSLVGRIEQIEHRLNQMDASQKQSSLTTPLNLDAEPVNDPTPIDITVKDAPQAQNLNQNLSVTEEYDRAHALLTQAEYQKAAVAFSDFIEKHGTHKLSSNAYYWLGETYMINKDFTGAAEQFLTGYKKFPEGNKAADSLLKLGIAMRALGKDIEACAVYSKLRRNINPIPGFIEKRMSSEEKELKCE